MTFLFDPVILDKFFRSPDDEITFRPAVEQFTQRVFGLPSKEFFPKHSQVLRDLRHLLVRLNLGWYRTQQNFFSSCSFCSSSFCYCSKMSWNHMVMCIIIACALELLHCDYYYVDCNVLQNSASISPKSKNVRCHQRCMNMPPNLQSALRSPCLIRLHFHWTGPRWSCTVL